MTQHFTLQQPIQIDFVRSCDVPLVWASSIVDNVDQCRTVLEKVELGMSVERDQLIQKTNMSECD